MSRYKRVGSMLLAMLGVATLGAAGMTAPATATADVTSSANAVDSTSSTTAPIIFVHGFDVVGTAGNDCRASFGEMESKLRSWGWTGPMYTVKFYKGDVNCQASIDHHNSHSGHYASGHSDGSHTQSTDIRHLAYHLAWFINAHFPNRQVKLVGHSMGGLIIRYMIRKVQVDDLEFPHNMYIGDVVTFGTPHAGTNWAYGCNYKQCQQMRPGSAFEDYLKTYASNPNANGGTDWTTLGSYDDGVVSEWSSVGMSAEHEAWYLGSMNIGHSDYMHRTSTTSSADVHRKTSSGWSNWYNAPHPVHWAWRALQRSDY
ncbi:MAG TPA: alpha/beta fold hydrolase [Kribbellaceae bacterium]